MALPSSFSGQRHPTGHHPILRLHTETACRRAAALRLTLVDVDPDWCLLRLHEKDTVSSAGNPPAHPS
jgi:hypothetical protein